MGGENEKVIQIDSPVGNGKIRIHTNNKLGEVHFHDDSSRLKVAIPTGEYWQKYKDWKKQPEQTLHFVDTTNKTQLTFKQFVNARNQLDVDIKISNLSIGTNLQMLEDFINRR